MLTDTLVRYGPDVQSSKHGQVLCLGFPVRNLPIAPHDDILIWITMPPELEFLLLGICPEEQAGKRTGMSY